MQELLFHHYLFKIWLKSLQIKKAAISLITIVEPTGVPARIDASSPVTAQKTEMQQAKIVTFLKLLNISMEETAGKIIRAEIRRVPTRFIASTIITAIRLAIKTFISFVLVPLAKEKSSSKVIAKMRL